MRDIIIDTLHHERAANLELVRTIPEPVCAERPAGLVQSPAWIVAHFCLADSFMLRNFGGTPDLDLAALFPAVGPGSDPADAMAVVREHFTDWPGVIAAAERTHPAMLAAMAEADDDALNAPHPNERAREWFPTLAHNLVYTVWHEGNHGGQLRAWLHVARHEGLLG